MSDDTLLELLVTPHTHERLRPGTPAELRQAQGMWAERSPEPLPAILVTADGSRAWPILDGIPDLLSEHALTLR
ncbi:MAG: hypothetical protein AMXMBFR64_00730 [Myxococcales bacterium]